MAEESKVAVGSEGVAETQDRGLFDFMGKKEDQKEDHTKPQAEEEVIAAEMEKVHVSEPEPAHVDEKKIEGEEGEKKKEGILEKLHHFGSGSSSSSSDEEEGEGGEKKKKKKKEKKAGDTSVPIEKCEGQDTQPPAEEKKGFLEKIKEKLPGQHKKQEEVPQPPAPAPAAAECASVAEGEEKGEKKGILEKIKEKLPGYHPKAEEEKEREKEKEAH